MNLGFPLTFPGLLLPARHKKISHLEVQLLTNYSHYVCFFVVLLCLDVGLDLSFIEDNLLYLLTDNYIQVFLSILHISS